MARGIYYPKEDEEKKEPIDKVQAALEYRKRQIEKTEKVAAALAARKRENESMVNGEYINSFVNDAGSFLTSASKDYNTINWETATNKAQRETRQSTLNDLRVRSSYIRSYLNSNKNSIGDTYHEMISYLDTMDKGIDEVSGAFKSAYDVFSQYDSQAAYDEAVRQAEEYQALLSYDVESAKQDIDLLQAEIGELIADAKRIGDAEKSKAWRSVEEVDLNALKKEFEEKYGVKYENSGDIYKQKTAIIEEKRSYLENAQEAQKNNYFTNLISNADFDEYVAKGKAVREESLYFNLLIKDKNKYLEEEEIARVDYLLGKNDISGALEYLSLISDYAAQREGKKIGENITGISESINIPVIGWAAEGLAELGYGLYSGVESWTSGVEQFFSGNEHPISATQHANAYISESLDDFGKLVYGAANTIGNMAPSILAAKFAGFLGATPQIAEGIGLATMGVSASGNAYGEALRRGYDKKSASMYGQLVGASEVLLEKLLGGIPGLNALSNNGKLMGKIAQIDQSVLRISAKLGLSAASEIIEEEAQLFLEPAFRYIIFNEDYDLPTFEDMLETAIVTAISTTALNRRSAIQDISETKAYKTAYGQSTNDLILQGLQSPEGSLSRDLAEKYQKKIDSGKELNGHEIKKLVEATEPQSAKVEIVSNGVTAEATSGTAVTLESLSQKYGAQAKAMIKNYHSGQDVASYDRAYQAAYDMGREGVSADYVMSSQATQYLTESQRVIAYETGRDAKKLQSTGFTRYEDSGIVDTAESRNLKKSDKGLHKEIDSFAKGWGVKVEIGNFSDWENGSIKNGVIRINAQKFTGESKVKTISKVLSHEITHRMQETAVQAYDKYRGYVLEIFSEQDILDSTIADYRKQIQKTREENSLTKEQLPDLTDEEIMDEIVADYTMQFLEDTQMFKDFISKSKEHKKLGQRMIDALKALIAKIKKNLGRSGIQDGYISKVEKALQLWEQAYQSGRDVVEISPAQKSTGDRNTKKSINYNSAGVSWLLNDEIINKNQMAKFYESVANISKRGYTYPRSKSGLYMVDLGNVIAFTDADFDNPQIYKAIEFFTEYENNLAEYKGWIYDEERNTAGHRTAYRAIEVLQGEGYVSEHIRKDYRANAWKDRPGEGADGSGTDTQDKIGRDSNRVKRSVSGTEDIIPTNAKKNEDLAVQFFGRTYSWKETGYLTRSGKKLDFSGRHEGGQGGYRSVDHRDIRDAIGEDYGGDSYSGAMVQFMREGNIRIMPESDGINLSVMPTKAQINALEDYISRARGEVILDLDDINGNTVSSTEYPRGTRASKVLSDIRTFFETGETPQISEVAKYRYSVSETENILLKNLFVKEYNQLLRKKSIKINKQDGRLIQAQRMSRYAGYDSNEIPILDIFQIGYDNKINNGVRFYVRNTDLDKFDVVRKVKIIPSKNTKIEEEFRNDRGGGSTRANSDNARSRSRQRNSTDGIMHIGNTGAVFTDDRGSKGGEESAEGVSLSESTSDFRTGIKKSISGTENVVSENLEKARKQYGEIPKGENPARDVHLPRKSSEGQNVSYTIRTALEAGVTPDVLVPKIEEKVIQGDFSDETHANKKTLAKAKKWLESFESTEKAQQAWSRAVKDGSYLNEETTVRGFMLYNQLATEVANAENVELQEKYAQEAITVLTDITNMTRTSARMVQATRLLKQLVPEGKFYSLQKSVDNLNQKILEGTAGIKLEKGRAKIEIDPDLAAKWMQALHDGDTRAAEQAEEQLYKSIARQTKRTFFDRWNAWRYLSMLGNAKTLIRNYAGNVAMSGAKSVKDKVGAAIELFLPKEKRTKYLGTTHTKAGEAVRQFAKEDYAETAKLLSGDAKYSDYSNQKLLRYIQEYKGKFQAHGVKEWQTIVDWVMNGDLIGDTAFMKKHYTNSFAQIAMARGWTASRIKNGGISKDALDVARGKAYREAQKATFRDLNILSATLRKMRFTGKTMKKLGMSETAVKNATAAGNAILTGVMPFRGTPANVLVRAVEYSPLELLWNMSVGTYQVIKGTIDATEYIDRWASGLTGTGIFALGMLLQGLGLVSGGDTDDDEKRTGYQSYALNIGGKSFTLDWLSPAAIPFFMGVELQNAVGENFSVADIVDVVSDSFQPMLEMSCLSGVQGMLESMSYAEGADFGQYAYAFFVNPFMSYIGQGIPTLLSQTSGTLESHGEKTFVSDIENQFMRNFTYDVVKIWEKLPFANWRQIPRIDAWGRVSDSTKWYESYFSPFYISDIKVEEADREIERLQSVFQKQLDAALERYQSADTNDKIALRQEISRLQKLINISPDLADTKINNVRLTQEEYTQYAKTKGENNYTLVTSVMDSTWYKDLTDEEKVKVINYAYDIADAKGKYEAVGLTSDEWTNDFLEATTQDTVAGIKSHFDDIKTKETTVTGNAALREAIKNNASPNEAFKTLRSAGKTDKEIYETARKEIKELFIDGSITKSTANSYYKKYGGLSSDEAVSKVNHLSFVKENPSMEDISESAVEKYNQYCKPANVSAQTYYDIWKYKNATSKDAQQATWKYINKLSLSKSQKDSLHLALGWSKSTLDNAPWH